MVDGKREVAQSPKGRARRERLLEVATRMFAREGSRGTSLARIAEEAGVSQAGLIYHFPTKEALLHAALDRRTASETSLDWEPGEEPGLAVVQQLTDAVEQWAKQPDLVGMLTVLVAENLGADGVLRDRLVTGYRHALSRVADSLAAGQRRGEVREDLDPHVKAIELIAFVNGLETAWLLDPEVPAAAVAKEWATTQIAAMTQGASLTADQAQASPS